MSLGLDAPKRIQRSRARGWRMPASAVYVGRPTIFGNPYRAGHTPAKWDRPGPFTAQDAVDCYALMLAGGWRLHRPPGYQIVERAMSELEGRDLCCWCPLDEPCHADVLLRYANGLGIDHATGVVLDA